MTDNYLFIYFFMRLEYLKFLSIKLGGYLIQIIQNNPQNLISLLELTFLEEYDLILLFQLLSRNQPKLN